jgi:restriction endonuclease S subunit
MELKDFLISEYFETIRGRGGLTRDYARYHGGSFPVYSAGRETPLTHIDTWDHDGIFLSWTTNGYAGYVQQLEGKFSINADRGLLKPLRPELVDFDYCRMVMQPRLRALAIGRIIDGKKNEYTKVSPAVVAETIIPMPVDRHGLPDKKAQTKLARKYLKIEACQKEIETLQERLENSSIPISHDNPIAMLSIASSEYFSMQIGKRILKKDILTTGVPAYSANVNEPFGNVAKSNLKEFTKPSLLWGIDGIFDWSYKPAGEVFATTDHCGILYVKSEELDPEYIYYALKGSKEQYGFDRTYRASLENMKEVVSVPVPVDEKGNLSLKEQLRIASIHKKLQTIRLSLLEQLEQLANVEVLPD